MNLRSLQQQIGDLKATTARIAGQLEISDRIADTCGHPTQNLAALCSATLRQKLGNFFTRLHELKSRLPTPETLSRSAYDRALMLGFTLEAAEVERTSTYRHALIDRAA
jgi:hypothetical protein